MYLRLIDTKTTLTNTNVLQRKGFKLLTSSIEPVEEKVCGLNVLVTS